MSIPTNVLSVLSEAVTKGLVDHVPNKAFSVDAMLKAQNIELFKNDAGVVEIRAKKIRKTQDKGIAKAEIAAVAAVATTVPVAPVSVADPVIEPAPAPAPVSVADPVVEPASAPAKKPVKKAKVVTGEEAAMLAPVDNVVVSVPANKPYQDAYSDHPSRLKVLDLHRCMGRRINEDEPLHGTRKGDPGANGKFFVETQCVKKPKEGKLCTVCVKMETAAKADTSKAVPRWYGRLDEPMYWNAYVVGCANFFVKYKNGLASDPLTAPKSASSSVDSSVVEKPTKKQKKPESVEESVAVDSAAKECEWVKLVHNGMHLVRNLTNGNVYQANTDLATPGEMVLRDKYEGRWIDGDLDSYAEEVDE